MTLDEVRKQLAEQGLRVVTESEYVAFLASAPPAAPAFCISCGAPAYRGDHNEGCKRQPAAPARTEAELDSPPFESGARADLEARGFRRINRHESARTEADKQRGEAFAKYHDEQASYGGVGWEFHARAATFCRDVSRTEAEPLHPDGRCTCGGGGSCEWCMTHCLHCGSGFPGGVPVHNEAQRAVLDAFKAGYNALPAIPSREQWKALCVKTMAAIEGWPVDDTAPVT